MEPRTFVKDQLQIVVFKDRQSLGAAAAREVSEKFRELLQVAETIQVVFAAAPSQSDFLATLVKDTTIEWGRIHAFHMDEYLGLPQGAPQSFSRFLSDSLFGKVPFRSVQYLNGQTNDAVQECIRYTKLLQLHPPDVVCLGIGENGHIAFNDPPVADFKDKSWVKRVELDQTCRNQQVNDGCFSALSEVPTEALTLTIPAIMRAEFLYCMVPGKTKADAVNQTLNGPISPQCPASILRTHKSANLFLDQDSISNTKI